MQCTVSHCTALHCALAKLGSHGKSDLWWRQDGAGAATLPPCPGAEEGEHTAEEKAAEDEDEPNFIFSLVKQEVKKPVLG